jgi:hypothetical protein
MCAAASGTNWNRTVYYALKWTLLGALAYAIFVKVSERSG